MYTTLSRFCFFFQRWPKTVVVFAIILTALSFYASKLLVVKTSLVEILPPEWESMQTLHNVQKKFGGLGQLSIVLQSNDSTKNANALKYLVGKLKSNPQIAILDYQREGDFFKQHRLLFIDSKDLQDISTKLEAHLWSTRKRHNPLLVDLLDTDEKKSLTTEIATLDELKKKYRPQIKNTLGTADGKILILRIFPDFESTDFRRCGKFVNEIKVLLKDLPPDVTPHLTGGVMSRIQEEGRLLKEVMHSGWISIGMMVFCLACFFYRMPTGLFAMLIALSMGVLWTMGLGFLIYGHLNLITLSLGIVLLGLGVDAGIHILARYREEREKGLSSPLAFETVLLETGPAIATSTLTSAAAFFAVGFTKFKGFAEFGWLTGFGLILTALAILLVFPALLQMFESWGMLPILNLKVRKPIITRPHRYQPWIVHTIILLVLASMYLFVGPQKKYEVRLSKLDFPNQNRIADSLLAYAGEAIAPPAVFLAPNQVEATAIANTLRQYAEKDTLTPTIHSILTYTDLLPKNQAEKMVSIHNLHNALTPSVLNAVPDSLKSLFRELYDASQISDTLTTDSLPQSFRRIFWGKSDVPGAFTFVFPAVNLDSGHSAQAFAMDTRQVTTSTGNTYISAGMAVIFADLLSAMIPDAGKALLISLIVVLLLLFLDLKSWRMTAIIIVPPLLGLMGALSIFKLFDIKLSYYNLILLPTIIGLGVDYAVYIFHRYSEYGPGSLYRILPKTLWTTGISILTSLAGFSGLAQSSHQGLQTLGISAIISLLCSFLAAYLWVPAIIGYFEKGKCGHDY